MNSLDRDARHLALEQVGRRGQQRIAAGTVLIIGAGGIGCAAATYLAASGVGTLNICDFDTIDVTNLGRQVLYTPADVGALKSEVATRRLQELNPDIGVSGLTSPLQGAALRAVVRDCDIVLDGSDNFATRFAVNDACVAEGRHLISGAAIRLEGQLAVFGPDYGMSPCYRCLYEAHDESLETCAGNGVLSPVPAVIGTLMAVETLKILAGVASDSRRLRLYDAGSTQLRPLEIQKREDCPACAALSSGKA